LLAQSPAKRFGEAPARLAANIEGAKLIELVARTPEARRFPDAVAWGDAALMR
jgi:hypothetical protein